MFYISIIGGFFVMIGIGGGVVFVLLLMFFLVDMKKVIGCVLVCGIVIVLFGLVGYISFGS